jgi:hypothetical protein
MHSIVLENADRRLGAPAIWNHEKDGVCHTLEIWDRDGFMISGWQPSPNDLRKFNAGEPLFLHIKGNVHPVVAMSVGYERSPDASTKQIAVSSSLSDGQIKHMVDRFLTWKLPKTFDPDCGISFAPPSPDSEPVGTNLLTAAEAGAMVRHMIEGMPVY